MNQAKQYLMQMTDKFKGSLPMGMEFVLRNGREYPAGRYEYGGPPKACFMNAYQMAFDYGYQYVEGYAVSRGLFPMEHAWCVDEEGLVVDPTWKDGTDYFGVSFDLEFLEEVTNQTEQYGILGSLYLIINLVEGQDLPGLMRLLDAGIARE